jgi:hypothetical protein
MEGRQLVLNSEQNEYAREVVLNMAEADVRGGEFDSVIDKE